MGATRALALYFVFCSVFLGCSEGGGPSAPSGSEPAGSIAVEIRDPDGQIDSFDVAEVVLVATNLDIPAKATKSTTVPLQDVALPATGQIEGLSPGDWQLVAVYRDGAGIPITQSEITAEVFDEATTKLGSVLIADGSQMGAEWRTTIRGLIQYDDRPLSETTSAEVAMGVIDRDQNAQVPGRVFDYDPATGRFELSNVPFAQLALSIFVGVAGGNPNLPGNLYGYDVRNFRVDAGVDRNDVAFDVAWVMHLTSPTDIATDRPPYPEYGTHSTPVRFEWDEIAEATRYYVSVSEYDTDPSWSYVRTVMNATEQTENSLVLNLDVVPSDHVYTFKVEAYGASGRVGVFRRVYANATGSDYRFHVE